MAIPAGWVDTDTGIAIPPSARPQMAEFEAFQKMVLANLPDLYKAVEHEIGFGDGQNLLAKSLAREPQTRSTDLTQVVTMLAGVKEAHTIGAMNPEILRNIVDRCPPVTAIVNNRCNQVAAFCQLPDSETDAGFKVALRNSNAQPDKNEEAEIRALEDMFLEGGFLDLEDEFPMHPLDEMVRMLVRDSLTFDLCGFEIVPGHNPDKYPCVALQPIDGAQIKLTEPTVYAPKRSGIANIVAVQVQEGQVVAEYQNSEVAMGIRNPTTAIRRGGYGISELEVCVSIISCILFGIDYNKQYFTSSSVPPGLLSISGTITETALNNLRTQWQAQMRGPNNWWNTPVVATQNGNGVNYIKFRDTNKDMEFHQLIALMINILCSCYCIHPEEISMQAWAPYHSALSEASPVARLQNSQDRGLKPLLKMLGRLANKVLRRMFPDGKYVYRWVNIDEFDEERDLKLREMRLNMGLTLPSQEIKDMDGEKHKYADVPVNPYHFQAYQMEQQEDMGQDAGYGEQYVDPEQMQGQQPALPAREPNPALAAKTQPQQPGKMPPGLGQYLGKSHRRQYVEVVID